ncbi:MAG: hypothetical protein ABJE95_32545 [Byssovorax sp.]
MLTAAQRIACASFIARTNDRQRLVAAHGEIPAEDARHMAHAFRTEARPASPCTETRSGGVSASHLARVAS